jgi:hypothetical protein
LTHKKNKPRSQHGLPELARLYPILLPFDHSLEVEHERAAQTTVGNDRYTATEMQERSFALGRPLRACDRRETFSSAMKASNALFRRCDFSGNVIACCVPPRARRRIASSAPLANGRS